MLIICVIAKKVKRIYKKIKNINKTYKILLFLLIISIWLIIWGSDLKILNVVPKNLQVFLVKGEKFTFKYEIISILRDLGIAYIASLMFYIVTYIVPKNDRINEERKRWKGTFFSLKKELSIYRDFYKWLLSDDFKLQYKNVDLSNPDDKIAFEIIDLNSKKTNNVLYKNIGIYIDELEENVLKTSKILADKIKEDVDLYKKVEEIKECVYFNIHTFAPPMVNHCYLDDIQNKRIVKDVDNFINDIDVFFDDDLENCCYEYKSAIYDKYIEWTKKFLFYIQSTIMLIDVKYLKKALNDIKINYVGKTIELDKLNLANKQMIEFIKYIDKSSDGGKVYYDDLMGFADLFKKSLKDNSINKYNLYFYTLMQFYYRINKQEFDKLINDYDASQEKSLKGKYFIYVLKGEKENADKISSQMDIEIKQELINNPITEIYKRIIKEG